MRDKIGLTLVLALLVVLFAPAAAEGAGGEPEPAFGPQEMWGAIVAPTGWGFTSTTITNPGPTISVAPGELVQLLLFARDNIPHQWVLDMNGNNQLDAGDIASGVFNSDTLGVPFNFNAPMVPGTYQYICGIHRTAQRGTFIVTGGNTPPTLTPVQPTGAARWTGGSPHTVQWTATDAEDPPSALTVWVNYSATGAAPWARVAGPLPGDVTSWPWGVPLDDTTAARIQWTVSDTAGGVTVVLSESFSVDSTPPSVDSTVPTDGATGVPVTAKVDVAFSESMNRAATGQPATVALQEAVSGAWVPVAYSWNAPSTTLTVNPASTLVPATEYRLLVNATARDGADPGLEMGAAFSMTFTTAAPVADVTPPTITNVAANPPTQTVGGTVEISATVTDDVGIGTVSVAVTLPDSSSRNETMLPGATNRFAFSDAWAQVGVHAFVVWASDTSANWNSASGSFTITAGPDTTRPEIRHTPPSGTIRAGESIRIEATVTDNVAVQAVRIDVTDVAGDRRNTTMTLVGGVYAHTIPAQAEAGMLRYRIYAVDASGNWNVTRDYSLTISAPQVPPTFDPVPFVAVAVVLAAVALVAFLFLRRRHRGEAEPPAGPPPGP